ncbi:MAG: DUF1501 domain-containing protein, partial [Verrucomicrobiales bacterium]
MTDHYNEDPFLTRRDFLGRCGMGMGALAGGGMLMGESGAATNGAMLNPLAPKAPHYPARAKRVIHLFMNGGPSQGDTFDPKPMLTRHHGKELPMEHLATERPTGAGFKSPFAFRPYGESGIEVSEIFSRVGECADDLCVIRSMHADVPNHEPSLMLMNCGEGRLTRPSMGSWINYGLGSENENLPGFVTMCPGGMPITEMQNWRAAFLPGTFQGTYIDTQHTEVEHLISNIRNKSLGREEQRRQLDLLQRLNQRHLERRQQEAALEARLQSFELAYRMQMEATDAFDVSREPEHIKKMYGDGVQARQILIARRLVERGVRFVQVWHGKGQPWDSHNEIEKEHRKLAGQCDQAIAALLVDLKQRGLLEDTLVIWGGEFGRTPTVELNSASNRGKVNGRDHNHHGFSMWLAGGGVKGGYVHGATDEFGFSAVKDRVHVHDLH